MQSLREILEAERQIDLELDQLRDRYNANSRIHNRQREQWLAREAAEMRISEESNSPVHAQPDLRSPDPRRGEADEQAAVDDVPSEVESVRPRMEERTELGRAGRSPEPQRSIDEVVEDNGGMPWVDDEEENPSSTTLMPDSSARSQHPLDADTLLGEVEDAAPEASASSEMERHVDKASRGENGERRVTATSEEPPPLRRSARESVLSAQGKVTKVEPMRKRDLPEASADLLRVLKEGSIGADDEQLGTLDELSEDSRIALLAWWPKMREGSETKQRLFSAWFRGKAETKCLGNQAITKAKSVFEHGAGFACRACVSQSRPCLALKRVDEKELLVAVRPSREEDGGRSFSYWQKPPENPTSSRHSAAGR